jgi:large-conductance mechanosensitive channel
LVAIGLTFLNQSFFYRTAIRSRLPDFPSTYALSYFTAFPQQSSCGTICITQLMDETARTSAPDRADAGTWIIRLLIAVILGEGIWGLIVSLTHNLILPLMAKTMGGGDVQSQLYLGKGDVNVPALFTSLLELCFAGIVAVMLNVWVQRKARSIRGKPVRVTPRPVQPASPAPAVAPVRAAASIAPPVVKPAPPPAAPVTTTPPSAPPPPSPEQFWTPPEPSPQPKAAAPPPPRPPAKPAKPKPPKEVYYNIVGEPINPTEE